MINLPDYKKEALERRRQFQELERKAKQIAYDDNAFNNLQLTARDLQYTAERIQSGFEDNLHLLYFMAYNIRNEYDK